MDKEKWLSYKWKNQLLKVIRNTACRIHGCLQNVGFLREEG